MTLHRLRARTARADARAGRLAPIVKELQAAGARSLWAIAAGLNARGVRTPRGVGGAIAGAATRAKEKPRAQGGA
jgi:hypothetical protein